MTTSNTFLRSLQPRVGEDQLPGEYLAFLRNSANLFNFGGRTIYRLQAQDHKIVAVEEKASYLSIWQTVGKIFMVFTVILPLIAYLGAEIYHRFNKIEIVIEVPADELDVPADELDVPVGVDAGNYFETEIHDRQVLKTRFEAAYLIHDFHRLRLLTRNSLWPDVQHSLSFPFNGFSAWQHTDYIPHVTWPEDVVVPRV